MQLGAWRYYLSRYRPHVAGLALAVFLALAQSLLALPVVVLIRRVFDTAIPSRQLNALVWIGLAIFGLTIAGGLATLAVRYLTLKITKLVIRDIRGALLDHLYLLSRSFYGGADRGGLHAGIVQDTERLDMMSNALVAQVLPAALAGAALCAVLAYLNWVLFLVLIAIAPVMTAVNRGLRKHVRSRFQAFRRSFEGFSKGVLFVLETMDLTRLQSAESFELERQRGRLEELRRTSGAMAWLDTAYQLTQHTLSVIASLLILVVGGAAVAAGKMSLGDLAAFYLTVSLLRGHAGTLLSVAPQLIAGAESLRVLVEVLHAAELEPYRGTRRIEFRGAIAFESVHFAYRDEPVLKGVDLSIGPGEVVAVVGPNGSGKTTLIHLICGFYRPQRGRLTADGQPYEELDIAHLRRACGLVPQDPLLFRGSIRDNIAYGSPQAGEEEVLRAAGLATADEFIRELPAGYDSDAGENGALLSGGQRQRIAIARAMLRRPRLLILDEPTNHLDRAAVSQLMTSLARLPEKPAILLISHDREIIAHAHKVFAVEDGRLVPCEVPCP